MTIKPEISKDYEVGVRSMLFDHHLVLNGTAYWTDYTNFQIQTFIPNVPNTFILANIPSARTRGVEVASMAVVTDDLSFNLGYAYTEAYAVKYPFGQCFSNQKFMTGAPATCSLAAPYQDLSGAVLPNAPKHKLTLGVNYRLVVPALPVDVNFNLATVWQSEENFAITKDPGSIQAAYEITNLSVEFSPRNDKRLMVSLFVNNLFDQHYASNLYNNAGNWTFSGVNTGYQAYSQNVPRDWARYFGIRLAVSNE